MLRLKLHWQILIAIVLAVLAGRLAGDTASLFDVPLVAVFGFFGTLFINALKMLIVPLIASSIIVGVAGIGSSGNLGKLGGKTLLFYALTTLAAILVGLVLVNFVQPGVADGEPAGELLALDSDDSGLQERVAGRGAGDVVQIFVKPIAGAMLAASVLTELSPLKTIVLGIIAGGSVAGVVHWGRAQLRLVSTATTAGLGNPVISFAEDGAAFAGSLLAVVAPLVVLAIIGLKPGRISA